MEKMKAGKAGNWEVAAWRTDVWTPMAKAVPVGKILKMRSWMDVD
jgi:hypothetical protein